MAAPYLLSLSLVPACPLILALSQREEKKPL
jgi:hypothetical protein